MRKGFLLLPCLLLANAAPLSAQYSYPGAVPGYSYNYAPPTGAQGYAVPVYPYPSPYSYPRYGYPGTYGYPMYNVGPAQNRPAAGPGYPYVYNMYNIRPVQGMAAPATLPATSPSGPGLPPMQVPARSTGPYRVNGGYPYQTVQAGPDPAAPPSAAAPAPPVVDANISAQAPSLAESQGEYLFPSPVAPVLPRGRTSPDTFWVRSEYLLWQIRNEPVPGPLVTTGNPTQGDSAGVLGVGGTIVLYGGGPLDMGLLSGGRLTIGGWVNDARTLGLEASGFALGQGSNSYAIASNSSGNPGIYIPAINAVGGTENRLLVADPSQLFAGNVAMRFTSQLSGVEANGLFNMIYTPKFRLDGLLGARYLNLNESFSFTNTTQDLIFLDVTTVNDHFQTQNQFYGGQAGLRMRLTSGRLLAELTGKVAAGTTHELVNVSGNGLQTGPATTGPVGAFGSGFFAQSTNIGRHSADPFSLVSQVGGRIGWEIFPHINIFAGYDFLYWNQTARVGNQIDRTLNLSQSPVFGPGALVGTPRPLPLVNSSAFFAHGVSLGLEFHY